MTGCCRHCARDEDGACRYLTAGSIPAHTTPCSFCQRGEYLRHRVGERSVSEDTKSNESEDR